MPGLRHALGAALIALAVAACGEDTDSPRVEIRGGGFIFNYREAEAFYGITVSRLRAIEPDIVLEASFEDPGGGPPIVVRQTAGDRLRWSFRTPPLQGVEADRDYTVELRLVDPATGAVLERSTRPFRSQVGQEVLPDRPLTVGPGYQPNR